MSQDHLSRQAPLPAKAQWFTTTHWSVVLAAGKGSSPEADHALEKLCRGYWYPTPMEAICCATLTPAEVLGVTAETGTIAVGKRADLVILSADPLQDIRNIRRVCWTVARGRVFTPGQLWTAIDFRPPQN